MDIHGKGGAIGYRHGKPIHSWITYKQGDQLTRMNFVRLAMEDSDGGFPLSQLKDGEFILHPGAIYQ